MKKIAIITMGVKLKGEKGYTRFGYLAEFLTKAGFQVDLITTSFQHWEKAQRDLQKIQEDIKAGEYPFGLRFIYEPGYNHFFHAFYASAVYIDADLAVFINTARTEHEFYGILAFPANLLRNRSVDTESVGDRDGIAFGDLAF